MKPLICIVLESKTTDDKGINREEQGNSNKKLWDRETLFDPGFLLFDGICFSSLNKEKIRVISVLFYVHTSVTGWNVDGMKSELKRCIRLFMPHQFFSFTFKARSH